MRASVDLSAKTLQKASCSVDGLALCSAVFTASPHHRITASPHHRITASPHHRITSELDVLSCHLECTYAKPFSA